jgi:hypothetical protein
LKLLVIGALTGSVAIYNDYAMVTYRHKHAKAKKVAHQGD